MRSKAATMFGTDLSTEYELASKLGVSAEDAFQSGLDGALCDETVKTALLSSLRRG